MSTAQIYNLFLQWSVTGAEEENYHLQDNTCDNWEKEQGSWGSIHKPQGIHCIGL